MDIISAASTLHQQLIALQNSDSTVTALDSKVTSLGHQTLMSAVEDNQSHHLRLVLRLSVSEGTQYMYQQYSERKWAQVQNTARTIKSNLEVDSMQQTTPVMMSSPSGGSTSPDKAAEVWSSVFCELSRHE